MRLASLQEYRRLFFTPDSAPSCASLRAAIRGKRQLGGVILNGRYYVDLDELERQLGLQSTLRARKDELEQSPELQGLV